LSARVARALASALLAAGLGACADEPGACADFAPDPWDPATEPDVRLDEATAAFSVTGPGAVDPDGARCAEPPCFAFAGPVLAETSFTANRGLAYLLTGTLVSDVPGRVQIDQIASDGLVRSLVDLPFAPGEVALAEAFTARANGDGETVLTVVLDEAGTATLDGLAVTGERWTAVEATSAAPLQLGFLVHVEDDANFDVDEAIWRRRADVVAGLSATLAARGAKLGIQADASFLRGAAVWAPDWVEDRVAEGAGWSVHIHDESDPALVEPAMRDGRLAHREVGVVTADLNGGFVTALWSEARSAGFASLSAYKNPETQGGLPRVQIQPWRPADGTGAADPDAFLAHDPDGPLVYLPGHDVREVDHARAPAFMDAVVSQVRAHTRADHVNTWYFVFHVDGFGPSADDDAAYDAYLADGFAADLAPYGELLDAWAPLVASGDLAYATTAEMTEAWLAWNAGCEPEP
jgi:hypothetical protein